MHFKNFAYVYLHFFQEEVIYYCLVGKIWWEIMHMMLCWLRGDNPINIASVHLVMGCPNARAGAKIVKKKSP